MNHIKMRRIALTAASVSFGVLTVVIMLWLSAVPTRGAGEYPIHNQMQQVSLPAPISCTPLVVEQLASYDGKFVEDGSGREVMDVAAIMLHNTSKQIIPYACVTVYTENCRYTFDAFLLPPEASVLVPESKAQKYSGEDVQRVFGWITVKSPEYRPELTIWEPADHCLQIENTTGSRLRDFKVFYRTYIADGDFYIGGKSYEAIVSELPPGGTIRISPENYVSGYSRVIYYE